MWSKLIAVGCSHQAVIDSSRDKAKLGLHKHESMFSTRPALPCPLLEVQRQPAPETRQQELTWGCRIQARGGKFAWCISACLSVTDASSWHHACPTPPRGGSPKDALLSEHLLVFPWFAAAAAALAGERGRDQRPRSTCRGRVAGTSKEV